MFSKLDAISCILIGVIVVAVSMVLWNAQPASATCNKFCGFCAYGCTQRPDPACTNGDKCLVRDCTSVSNCSNILICGQTCQSDPNCCSRPGYVDECGSPGSCVYVSCPCL